MNKTWRAQLFGNNYSNETSGTQLLGNNYPNETSGNQLFGNNYPNETSGTQLFDYIELNGRIEGRFHVETDPGYVRDPSQRHDCVSQKHYRCLDYDLQD